MQKMQLVTAFVSMDSASQCRYTAYAPSYYGGFSVELVPHGVIDAAVARNVLRTKAHVVNDSGEPRPKPCNRSPVSSARSQSHVRRR